MSALSKMLCVWPLIKWDLIVDGMRIAYSLKECVCIDFQEFKTVSTWLNGEK